VSDLAVELTITSILSRGKRGGVIMAGTTAEGERYVACCSWKLVPDATFPDKGQRWAVRGPVSTRSVVVNGQRKEEQQIKASHADLVRPAGKNIIAWIAGCKDAPGIGTVKATKLFERFGADLVKQIEMKNVEALSAVISAESAELLCHAFHKHKVAETLFWLDQIGMQRHIGQKIVSCYKDQARTKIEANPYAMISFDARWSKVDGLATNRFGIAEDDPRRLEAAVEEALYRGLKDGHTCLPTAQVKSRLKALLQNTALIEQALALGQSTQFRRIGDIYQPTGTYLVEQEIAQRLVQMIAGEAAKQQSIFASEVIGRDAIEAAIARYERAQGFDLSAEQRRAVLCSATANVSLILGGAGTGKTTVLKALYEALEATQPGIAIYQVALAGRAAQRMSEATGRDSSTIAGFLSNAEEYKLGSGSVIVVDEVSMVDAILFYRLLRHIQPGTRLILVGDPSQLPPIGPGLVLHALAGHPAVPQTELIVVKRQSDASGIPQVAAAVRAHTLPDFAPYAGRGNGVSFVECAENDLSETVQLLYDDLGGTGDDYSVQILSTTRSNAGGVQHLNQALHERYRQENEPVFCHDAEFGVVQAATLERVLLKVGDLVIFTKNDYTLGLRNGSLGRITRAMPVESEESDCCSINFEGVEYILKTPQLHTLSHSYAITIHKSQGSQFSRVIVPIKHSRLLDQTLLYTAITRGVEQVILVGNLAAATAAILAPASAARRHVSLPALLEELRPADPGPVTVGDNDAPDSQKPEGEKPSLNQN